MRFFFEFVSCCGLLTQRVPEPAVPAAEEEMSLVPAAEEERSLVPATVVSVVPSRRPCRKKMRMGAAEWRPSLRSISEDVAAPPPRERESPRKGAVASAGRDAKRRSSGGAAKVRHRSYSDGYYGLFRLNQWVEPNFQNLTIESAPSMPMMMPTFMF
ncbi:hypothetical protein JHK84_034080 [Glycine max]|nr:hypothetical protein JHK85_034454 [Glycine max]KAG4986130.1 hypothetical protein JHK86_033821 [Glycine max]KAG5140312.1 hypothetical protein JHK84_034080 [Glycine max]